MFDPNILDIEIIEDDGLLLYRAGCVPELVDIETYVTCTYQETCYGPGADGGHEVGDSNCQYQVTVMTCYQAGGVSDCTTETIYIYSCTNGSSTASGGEPGEPNNSGGGGNSNNNNNDDENETDDDVPAKPLDKADNQKKNCRELNKLTSPPAYNSSNPYVDDSHPENTDGLNTNTRLAIINADQELNNDVEHGFGLYNQGNFLEHGPYANHVPANNGTHSINFPPKPFQFGTIHTHPSNTTNRTWIPMFSLEDIYSVLEIRNLYTSNTFLNNNNPNGDALFTAILVTEQEGTPQTYAIKIEDISKFQKLQDVFNDEGDANGDGIDEFDKMVRDLKKRYLDDANNIDGTAEQYQRVLLQFIEANDLGLSLYQMQQTNAGTPQVEETWQKLELQLDGAIVPKPCN